MRPGKKRESACARAHMSCVNANAPEDLAAGKRICWRLSYCRTRQQRPGAAPGSAPALRRRRSRLPRRRSPLSPCVFENLPPVAETQAHNAAAQRHNAAIRCAARRGVYARAQRSTVVPHPALCRQHGSHSTAWKAATCCSTGGRRAARARTRARFLHTLRCAPSRLPRCRQVAARARCVALPLLCCMGLRASASHALRSR